MMIFLQDNLRTILSILIIILVAIGIWNYNHSKKEDIVIDLKDLKPVVWPCEHYKDEKLQYVPARCIQYFLNQTNDNNM